MTEFAKHHSHPRRDCSRRLLTVDWNGCTADGLCTAIYRLGRLHSYTLFQSTLNVLLSFQLYDILKRLCLCFHLFARLDFVRVWGLPLPASLVSQSVGYEPFGRKWWHRLTELSAAWPSHSSVNTTTTPTTNRHECKGEWESVRNIWHISHSCSIVVLLRRSFHWKFQYLRLC